MGKIVPKLKTVENAVKSKMYTCKPVTIRHRLYLVLSFKKKIYIYIKDKRLKALMAHRSF